MASPNGAGGGSLLHRLKSGEPEAGNELTQRYWAPLVNFVRGLRMSREIRARGKFFIEHSPSECANR